MTDFKFEVNFTPESSIKVEPRLTISLPFGVSASFSGDRIDGHPKAMLDLSQALADAVAKYAPEVFAGSLLPSGPDAS